MFWPGISVFVFLAHDEHALKIMKISMRIKYEAHACDEKKALRTF
jgi:hypothetical protein